MKHVIEIYVINLAIVAILSVGVKSVIEINNRIDSSEDDGGKELPKILYVQDKDVILNGSLKGIKALLYKCGEEGITKEKAETIHRMLKLLLNTLKPLQKSDVMVFNDFIRGKLDSSSSSNVMPNEHIISKDIYKDELDNLDILGVHCNNENCFDMSSIWDLLHTLSVAKAHEINRGYEAEFSPFQVMNIIIETTNCMFGGDSEKNPFSHIGFGRSSWIKETNDYMPSDEICNSAMGLVMWLWRLHNAIALEDSIVETIASPDSIFLSIADQNRRLLKDARFPSITECKDCRTNESLEDNYIPSQYFEKYINLQMELIELDYIEGFRLDKTYEYLLEYYGHNKWYYDTHKIKWNEASKQFDYTEISMNTQQDIITS